jgi:hypothetical protein
MVTRDVLLVFILLNARKYSALNAFWTIFWVGSGCAINLIRSPRLIWDTFSSHWIQFLYSIICIISRAKLSTFTNFDSFLVIIGIGFFGEAIDAREFIEVRSNISYINISCILSIISEGRYAHGSCTDFKLFLDLPWRCIPRSIFDAARICFWRHSLLCLRGPNRINYALHCWM